MLSVNELCGMEGKHVKITDDSGNVREGTLHCYSEINESDDLEFHVMVNGIVYEPGDIEKIEYL